MAAPTPTTRLDPVGLKLTNGYRTLYAFAADPDIAFWEIGITPSGLDGGEPIDISTMHNDELRTKAPQALQDTTPSQLRAAYDPAVYPQLRVLINVSTVVTEHYPDGSSLCYHGYLKSFQREELVNGEFPMATCEVIATNYDPATGTEEDAVFTTSAGTAI